MKQQRHSAIRDLLAGSSVSSQDELRLKLAEKGYHVTQATLSRDIHEMRLSKGPAGYSLPREDDEHEELPGVAELLKSFGLEARRAQNLIVLITATGSAQTVAAGVDYEDWPEVIGTIAGDDTVLIICANDEQSRTLQERMDGYIG